MNPYEFNQIIISMGNGFVIEFDPYSCFMLILAMVIRNHSGRIQSKGADPRKIEFFVLIKILG